VAESRAACVEVLRGAYGKLPRDQLPAGAVKATMAAMSITESYKGSSVSKLRELLVEECNVNALLSSQGKTRLTVAAENGYAAHIEIYLVKGAEINKALPDGSTPLYLAAKNGHADAVEVLVSNGADPNKVTSDGWTALLAASRNGHQRCVMQLLYYGANASAVNKDGCSSLLLAADRGKTDVLALLLARSLDVLNKGDKDGDTPLIHAAAEGHAACVDALLAKGAEVHKANKLGRTAVLAAAANGQTGCLEVLLAKGGDVAAVDLEGNTALHHAANGSHTGAMERLIAKGAAVNAVNQNNATPLLFAASKGLTACVELLLLPANSADVDLADASGRTPLHVAAFKGHATIVQRLLSARSNASLRSKGILFFSKKIITNNFRFAPSTRGEDGTRLRDRAGQARLCRHPRRPHQPDRGPARVGQPCAALPDRPCVDRRLCRPGVRVLPQSFVIWEALRSQLDTTATALCLRKIGTT